MKRPLTAILGLGSLSLSILSVMFFYGVGNHGHFVFRRHMTEDWFIWGFALVTALLGIKQLRAAIKPSKTQR